MDRVDLSKKQTSLWAHLGSQAGTSCARLSQEIGARSRFQSFRPESLINSLCLSLPLLLSLSMARILSQTLVRSSPSSFFSSSNCPSISPHPSRLLNLRNRSNQSDKSHLIEVDLDPEDSDGEVLGMRRRLEDAIQGIIVRQSAPDWLPFIPGSSYWIPPQKRPHSIVELVGRLANPLSEEETMSLTTVRGWPSLAYFIDGESPNLVKEKSKKKTSQSEDEG